MGYFLGIDIGNSKSHALIADNTGRAIGYGEAACGSPEALGYEGMAKVLLDILNQALSMAGITIDQISGAGFGMAGYDWPSQTELIRNKIDSILAPSTAYGLVNDTLLGLLAGSTNGFGLAVVAGTGCNCWGINPAGQIGRVTGEGGGFAEWGSGGDVIAMALHAVSKAWSKRGPETRLTQAFLSHFNAPDVLSLLEGLARGRYHMEAKDALMVVQLARDGDAQAVEILAWNGVQLGDLASGVIRQLHLEEDPFEIVLIGSLFECGDLLIEPMRKVVANLAPGARLIPLPAKPVTGGVVLGAKQVGRVSKAFRQTLLKSAKKIQWRPTASVDELPMI